MKKQEQDIKTKKRTRKGEYKKCMREECNVQVYCRPFELKRNINKFCSNSCKAKTIKNKPKTGRVLTCENCKKEFYAQLNEILVGRKCCSPECANKAKTGIALMSAHVGFEKPCKTCKNPFYVALWNQHQKYCSTDCYVTSGGLKYRANYNVDSIDIIEDYGKQYGYKFKHALNGGEFRVPGTFYHVDAYDAENNVVLEIDEAHHFLADGSLKPKDIKRQCKIQEILKCKFIRIKI